ncbi:hypothetical protein [Singulisphaera acidiphila]|uniref:Uncharacterized protein n=1 Tax=Singulisphaera acidiphila (strain ATCC BAA-1392 / DSM 18658 / VKM B-2454 / MOB10) TaxID=886293 RepID=L0DCM7_SINAD|nr:hypothetical protein [Singulisphaera acidiphila]AGA26386.1 hypothetical protein Sinac_2041 [Singulisphaera acidiphila DSM 18658]
MTTVIEDLFKLPATDQADTLAAAIGFPTKPWPRNCFAVSSMICHAGVIPGAVVRSGHFDGKVSEDAGKYGLTPLRPIQRRGWIERADDIEGHGPGGRMGHHADADWFGLDWPVDGPQGIRRHLVIQATDPELEIHLLDESRIARFSSSEV